MSTISGFGDPYPLGYTPNLVPGYVPNLTPVPHYKITINPNVWPPSTTPWEPWNPDPWPTWPDPFTWPPEEEKKKKLKRIRNPKKRRAQVRRRKNRKRAPVRRKERDTMARKKKETHIVLVLDKSYSMYNCQKQALAALNEQIDGIKANAHKGGKTYVSIVLFSDKIDIIEERCPAKELEHVTMSDYVLDGNTSLRDAMMTAIDLVQPEMDRKKNQGFLVVLVSDGAENSSGTSQEQLKDRIDELEGSDRWTFTYMLDGHSWEEIETLAFSGYGQNLGNYASFTNSAAGMSDGSTAIRCASVNYMDERAQGITAKKDFYTDKKLKLEGVGTIENKT